MSQSNNDEDNYTLESGITSLQEDTGSDVSGWARVNDCLTDSMDILRDVTVDTPIAAISGAFILGGLSRFLLFRR